MWVVENNIAMIFMATCNFLQEFDVILPSLLTVNVYIVTMMRIIILS